MTTWTALTTLKGKGNAENLADALDRLTTTPSGVGCFEIEDGSGLWEVGGYFEAPPDVAGLSLLAQIHGAAEFAVSKLDDRDWVAQVRRELTPVQAGRFVVYGAHDRDLIGPEKIGLEIEAAMAFGTGHHATTLGCLQALDSLRKMGFAPRHVLDVGCGTGVLAMAAARACPWAHVTASDIDATAVAAAKANGRVNRVAGLCVIAAAGLRQERLAGLPRQDLIFANILARPLRLLAPSLTRRLSRGGVIVLSGVLNRQAAGVAATYRAFGMVPVRRHVIGEWSTQVFARP